MSRVLKCRSRTRQSSFTLTLSQIPQHRTHYEIEIDNFLPHLLDDPNPDLHSVMQHKPRPISPSIPQRKISKTDNIKQKPKPNVKNKKQKNAKLHSKHRKKARLIYYTFTFTIPPVIKQALYPKSKNSIKTFLLKNTRNSTNYRNLHYTLAPPKMLFEKLHH